MYTPVNPSFTIWEWGLRGSVLYRHVFVMGSRRRRDEKQIMTKSIVTYEPIDAQTEKNCSRRTALERSEVKLLVKCRLFMSSAEYSCKLFKPIFTYRQTVWTLIRVKHRGLALKMPRKPASGKCRLFMSSAEYSCKLSNLFLHIGKQCGHWSGLTQGA